ncbi:hypothetical protein B0H21DRAFT_377270 [Amylocystis lapponica]|nr:hypothetical protein B0H21DRAFT_377270 [Amylocystis lapponica]
MASHFASLPEAPRMSCTKYLERRIICAWKAISRRTRKAQRASILPRTSSSSPPVAVASATTPKPTAAHLSSAPTRHAHVSRLTALDVLVSTYPYVTIFPTCSLIFSDRTA